MPTIPGGVDLPDHDPATVLVGTDLAYGAALPSEQDAVAVLAAGPEVTSALVRRAYVAGTGRHLGSVTVLALDGHAFFDDAVLSAFERGLVAGFGEEPVGEVARGGRTLLRTATDGVVALGYRHGNLLVVVRGPTDAEVDLATARQLEAIDRGDPGTLTEATPLVALPVDAAFVPVPGVSFAPFPGEADDPPPVPPALPGTRDAQGRYGVVAGERRTVVWAFAVDPATYASAEALAQPMRDLVAARAGGAAVTEVEIADRVVASADGRGGEARAARAFRHHGLVLLVEGDRPDQVDAVATAWITVLAAQGG